MPVVRLHRPKSAIDLRADRSRKAILITGDTRIELPFAPREAELTGDAVVVTPIDRPGRHPLTKVTGDGLRILSFTATLAHKSGDRSVEPILRRIRRLAAHGRPLIYQHGSGLEDGVWRITNLTSHIYHRQEHTNAATYVDLTVELTQATDADVKRGPASGGHDDHHHGSHHGSDKPRTYTVKAGDTLPSIARRFYGNPNLWHRIADANGIRHPKRLKAGRKLRIPRRTDPGRTASAAQADLSGGHST